MPRTEITYPEWVQKYRERGTTVKKKEDSYYLYKRTSKRVPGKKYPQPVDTYIGIITPEGVEKTQKKKVTLTDIEVRKSHLTYLSCVKEGNSEYKNSRKIQTGSCANRKR